MLPLHIQDLLFHLRGKRESRHVGRSSTLTHAGAVARDYRAAHVDTPQRKTKAVGALLGLPPLSFEPPVCRQACEAPEVIRGFKTTKFQWSSEELEMRRCSIEGALWEMKAPGCDAENGFISPGEKNLSVFNTWCNKLL